jgi:hypothetical protein
MVLIVCPEGVGGLLKDCNASQAAALRAMKW